MEYPQKDTVFIIEDDPIVSQSTATLLKSQGLSSTLFTTAEDFLDKTENSITGCVISDFQLEGDCDGIELLKRMRGLGYRIPVIIVSGSLSISSKARAEGSGAYAVIDKPYNPQRLLETVSAARKYRAV